MEIDENTKLNFKCFKYGLRVRGPLNIAYNPTSTFILWNKYEIFVYENLIFENASKILVPDFQICYLISSNNFIVCLDFAGNIHIASMKFKHSSHKHFKNNFMSRGQGVLSCAFVTAEKVLCLKLEHDSYYFCVHKLNAEFELEKKIDLTSSQEHDQQSHNPLRMNLCILKCYKLHEKYDNLMKIFNIPPEDEWKNHFIIIISFDRKVIYGCIFSPKTVNKITLHKLYTAPSGICDVELTEENHVNILISLTAGNLIKISLHGDSQATEIVHLNTAISKCVPFDKALIYTDGISMWKSDNTFTTNIQFRQLLVKQVKDFICFGDQILCTTFTNLIYLFNVNDETSYLKSSSSEYCEAGIVLNDSGYVYKILEEVEKNDNLQKKIKEESDYITALSLSNRPDILDSILHYSVIVYESYIDVFKDYANVTLTDNVKDYFAAGLIYLLLKITINFGNDKISGVLLQILRDLQVHITLLCANKVIKTISIRIDELKNINLLLPLNCKHTGATIGVNVKIVKRIPGVLDKEQILWTVLHLKNVIINAEHFIDLKNIKENIYLKEPEHSIQGLIHQMALNSNGHLFKFTDIANNEQSDEFSFYVKLPDNYKEAFKNENFYKEKFNYMKAVMLLHESTSEKFLKGSDSITFEIGNSKVKIVIITDEFTSNSLKVTSDNIKVGFDIRNFYCSLAYDNYKKCQPEEFIRYTLYATIENQQKAIKQCLTNNPDNAEIKTFLEQLQRYVYGALPL